MRPLYLVPLAFLSLSACVVHETAPQPTTTTIVTPAPAPTATVLAPALVIVPTPVYSPPPATIITR